MINKKLLALLLTGVMALSSACVPVFAEEAAEASETETGGAGK